MKMRLPFLFLFSLLIIANSASGQKEERSLLWRISGKGMTRPSYLYGTFHMRVKRLFDFPDSLYSAIDNTEVFALEINFDSMTNGLSGYMGQLIDDAAASEIAQKGKKEKKLKEILTREELKTLKESLDENNDINPDELTLKQVYMLKDKFVKHKKRKDDMPTFMDAFLFQVAHDKGKIIGGLEHIDDQLKLMSGSTLSDIDPKKVMEFFKQGESIEDQMITFYLDKDLEKIKQISSIYNQAAEDALLTNRNKVMIRSMDSIMHGHSLFSAVGAMHLPGKTGLINMLREQGYTVEPVFCKTTTNGADYTFKKEENSWVTMVSEKDGYSIKMPGKPSDIDAMGGLVKMKMYFDFGTGRYYLTAHIPKASSTISTESVIDAMEQSMIKDPRGLETKELESESMKGKEYFFSDKDDNHFHVQLFGGNMDVYMLMAYSKNWNIRSVDSFFKSFRLVSKSKSAYASKTFDDVFVTAVVPDEKPTRSVTYTKDSTQKQIFYTITDPATSAYYFIVSNQTATGYNFTDNRVWIDGIKEVYKKSATEVSFKKTRFNNFDAHEFEAKDATGARVGGFIVYAGNRVYKFLAQYADGEANAARADSFFKSIVIHAPYPVATYPQQLHSGTFSINGPHEYKLLPRDTNKYNADTTEYSYKSWDSTALLTYYITTKKLSQFYWNSNDSLVLQKWLHRNFTNNDSTIEYTYYKQGDLLCGEGIALRKHTAQLHHIKVAGDGRTRYTLDCSYPVWMKDSKEIKDFYASFKVLKKDPEILQQSPASFFEALHSSDSSVHQRAYADRNNVYYSEKDIPVLLKQASTAFPDDTGYFATGNYLITMIDEHAAKLSVTQLEQLYRNEMTIKRKQQFRVLCLIAGADDSIAAYKKISDLLASAPPRGGNAYQLGYKLRKKPILAAKLFPGFLSLVSDSLFGNNVASLANFLIDSNYLAKDVIGPRLPMLLEQSKLARRTAVKYPSADLLSLLTKFSSAEVWDEIKQYQSSGSNYVKFTAIKLLCDSAIAPDVAALDSLGSDTYYRLEIYNLLAEKNLLGLFPKKYLTQQYFAETYISNYDDEGMYASYIPLGEHKTMYNGKKQKFFLFELPSYDDSDAHYLGIAGPFSDNSKIVTLDEADNATGVYETAIDKNNLDNQLKLYLIKRKMTAAEDNE